MKKHVFLLLSIIGMLLFSNLSNGQPRSLANQGWNTTLSTPPDTVQWGSSSVYDYYTGTFIVVGSNVVGSNSSIVTTSYTNSGSQSWQKTYNHSIGHNDFAVAVAVSGPNIFVLGASYDPTTKYDYVVIEYNATGTKLWEARYDDGANGDDFPVAMYVDGGNVYVTGMSTGITSGRDISTVKFNNLGGFVWSKTYDYNGHNDYATGITKASGGNIYVSGGTADAANNRAFTVIKYKAFDGTQMDIIRQSYDGDMTPCLNMATAIGTDASKNVFATGVLSYNGINFFGYTAKYDSALNRQWSDTMRSDSIYVEPMFLKVDASNNIFMGGYEQNKFGGNTYIFAKYNNSGALKWKLNYYGNYQNKDSAQLMSMFMDDSSNIFALGSIQNGSTKYIATVYYDSSGRIRWNQIYNPSGKQVVANNVTKDDDGNVVVTGVQKNGSTLSYVVQEYKNWDYTDTVKNDSYSKPWYLKHQLIIDFDPAAINTTIINNKDTLYGMLKDFVTTAMLDSMDGKLGLSGDNSIRYYRTKKIYLASRTIDSIFINASGDTMKLPPFWAHLIVYLPSNLDEANAADTLEQLSLIWSANRNYLFQLANAYPNDPNYTTNTTPHQFSLKANGTYPNADINIDPVWNNFHVKGDPSIVIGDFDTGIKLDHVDFADGGPNIKGKDYTVGYPYVLINNQNAVDNDGHGTATAGIIAANSDNGKGIAGIAGGDYSATPINKGCGLVMARILSGSAPEKLISTPDLIAAIYDVNPTQSGTFSANVINASWWSGTNDPDLEEAFRVTYFSNITVVAAVGNSGTNIGATANPVYPASYNDNWIIATGASGIDGKYQSGTVSGGDTYASNYGDGTIDLIAPGDDHIVYTTSSTGTSSYAGFSGTSASAAHVSGVAGLLLSYYKDYAGTGTNLSNDDIQYILKHSANATGITPPDQYSGYGRLDAGNAFNFADRSNYIIQHIERASSDLATTSTPIATGVPMTIDQYSNYDLSTWSWGTYSVDIYQVNLTIPFPHGAIVEDCWPQNSVHGINRSLSYDGSASGHISGDPELQFVSKSSTSAIFKGYLYYIVKDQNNTPIGKWLTLDATSSSDRAKIQAAISIRKSVTSSIAPQPGMVQSFKLYPNPTSHQITLNFDLQNASDATVEVTDIQGKILYTKLCGRQPAGTNNISLDVSNYTTGVYIVSLKINDEVHHDKFIKF